MSFTGKTLIIFSFLLWQRTDGHYVIKYDIPQTRNNISDLCAAQMEIFVTGLTNLDIWAITMLDASSKIPVGILTGNVIDLGNFDECIKLEHKTETLVIRGKHCMAGLNVPLAIDFKDDFVNIASQPTEEMNLGVSLSLCIPDACKPTEVASYLNIEQVFFNDQQCQIDEVVSLDGGDIAAVTFLSIILCLLVASTVYDVYLFKTDQTTIHPILLAFSVFTNGRKLIAVNSNDQRQLTSLHGLRCISMLWIVAGHRYSTTANLPSMNMVDIIEFVTKLHSQYIQSAYIAVDTFFFISGMMISYGFFYSKTNTKKISYIPMYYLHRYLRITPAVGVLFFVSVTIIRHVGSGPLWPTLKTFSIEPCLTWWWSYFLYLQNYVNYDDMCLIPTWYLSADMQMFLLSPFIMLPLGYLLVRKSKNMVYGACASLVLAFMIIQAIIKLNVDSENIYMTHERLAIWMIGFTAGFLMKEIKSKNRQIKMNSLLNLFIWVVVLVGMVSILLTMHDVRQNPIRIKTNMYDTFHRPAWGIGLAWIIYSCTIGYGGFVNWFLSLPAFQVLSRLTYCMYLVHILPIIINAGQMRQPNYFSDYNVYYAFCGDLICTVILALIWSLAFESPMIIIEKCIFGGNTGSRKDNKKHLDTAKIDLNAATTASVPIV